MNLVKFKCLEKHLSKRDIKGVQRGPVFSILSVQERAFFYNHLNTAATLRFIRNGSPVKMDRICTDSHCSDGYLPVHIPT